MKKGDWVRYRESERYGHPLRWRRGQVLFNNGNGIFLIEWDDGRILKETLETIEAIK